MTLLFSLWSELTSRSEDLSNNEARTLATVGTTLAIIFIVVLYAWVIYVVYTFDFRSPNSQIGIAILAIFDPSIAIGAAYLLKK